MYIMSRGAGWGRNFWRYVGSGTIDIRAMDGYMCATIHNGIVTRFTTRNKDDSTTVTYGQGSVTRKGNKTVRRVYYEPSTLTAIRRGSLWKKETGVDFCGSKGTVECYSTSSGAYGKEVFTYRNGVQAYVAARWRKKLVVKRPDGKLWVVLEGQVQLNYHPIAGRLNTDAGDIPLWGLMRGPNWKMTVYGKDGKTVVTQGQVENRQKHGRWLEDGKDAYYMSGVKVSQQLFEEDPDKWNAREVLVIPNAQLRCSLLNRMGYDKLLGKVKHKIVDRSADGGQLIEINTNVNEDSSGRPEKVMRLVKVICPSTSQVYVIRVPPRIDNYEQARHWTFGLQEQSISNGVQFELVKET